MRATVVFLASHAHHARMWRRIRRVSTRFSASKVLAFDRPTSTPAGLGIHVSLGTIRNARYLERLHVFASALRSIRITTADAAVVYCFSLDLLALAWLANLGRSIKPRLAYEIADIRDILAARGLIPSALRLVERFLIRRTAVVVLTSQHYRDGYFREVQRFTRFRYVVIEHKPEVPAAIRDGIPFRRDTSRPIRIGYFGIMKSPASFNLLMEVARAGHGRFEVVMRGIFGSPLETSRCLSEIAGTEHVRYEGPYKSPDDLISMYLDVDLIWDAYNESANSRWQRTTRFSEALFFKRPLLFNPETQDGRLASQYNLGLAVDLDDTVGSISRILATGEAEIEKWRANMESVPDSLVVYQDEYETLHCALNQGVEAGRDHARGGLCRPNRPERAALKSRV